MEPPIATYAEARRYLTARLDFEGQPNARPYSPTHYSLDRFVRLLGRMGNPQARFPSVHIAGSKGKGSVAILLESALLAAGLHTGTYTSPHLRDYPERFRIDGRIISEAEFTQTLARVAESVESDGRDEREVPPYRTVFELLTAMAFDLFARRGVDLAVLETGLGGRLDCTNVVRPETAVITPLGLDHTALLGDTLDRIAFEKGGIIKEETPVVIAAQPPAARAEGLPVLLDLAVRRRAPVVRAKALFEVDCLEAGEEGQTVLLRKIPGDLSATGPRPEDLPEAEGLELLLPLAGDHQRDNLRTAAAVWAVLRRRGWNLSWEAFQSGIARAKWPGRMDIVPARPRVVVDGAHCPLSARALVRSLDALYPGAPRHILLGAQRDKNIPVILAALMGRVGETAPADPSKESGGEAEAGSAIRSWAFYTVPGGRGARAEELAEKAVAAGIPQNLITTHPNAAEAFDAVFRRADAHDVIVSCGTLYTIAEILDRARGKLSR